MALACCLVLAACGDDPKEGGRALPSEIPTRVPPSPGSPTPDTPRAPPPFFPTPGQTAPSLTGWAVARVGDWATWEVRAPGTDSVTSITWRVTQADGRSVRYAVHSKTVGADGKTLATADADEAHDAFPSPTKPGALPEALTVAGKSMTAWKKTIKSSDADTTTQTTTWTSADAPFSGIVKSVGPGGAEQVLVAWGRGGG